jgi:predicted permease
MPEWRTHVRRVLADAPIDPAHAERIVAELVDHLDDRYRQSLAEGASEEEAHARALDELSDVHPLIEELTAAERRRPPRIIEPSSGGSVMSGMWQDWRYAWRLLRKDPWFTLVGAITLALGIGANGAIFSVVHAVLLRPLPYANPNDLVMIWESRPREGVYDNVVSPADFLDWRARQQVFDGIAAQWTTPVNLTGSGEPERIDAGNVSASFFSVLGVVPALGRDFRPDEEQGGRHQVAILNYGFWQRRFGGDPRVVGREVTLDEQPYQVIGVLPDSFRFPDEAIDVWRPTDVTSETMRARFNHFLRVYARLKADVSLDRAQANLNVISAQLQQEVMLQNQGHGARVVPLRDELVGDVRQSLTVLMAAVGCILLIACVNVANLLLVRGAARRKEVSLRAALGAARGRLVRQLVLECVTLAGVATLIALPVAIWGIELLKAFVPTDVPRLNDAGVNLTVLGFMVGAAVLTAVLFSLAPIWQVSTVNLAESLNDRGMSAGSSRRRTRRVLVVAEIAVAFVLLVGAGLMTRTLMNLLTVDSGFVSENVLTVPLTLTGAAHATPQAQAAFLGELLAQVRVQSGVLSAGYTSHVPMSGDDSRSGFAIEGREPDRSGEPVRAHWRVTTPGYFAAMQIRLDRGRWPTDADTQNRAPVAVINRTAAERFWRGTDPIGKRLRIVSPEWREIIAVVDDVRHWGPASPVNPEVYLPGFWPRTSLVVRTTQNPEALTTTIREHVRRLSPSLPVDNVRTMEEIRGRSVASPRFYLMLLTTFGVVALVLAVFGVYGLVSYAVAHSRHEIGIRMAIGARGSDVVHAFLREGVALTAIGLVLGAAAAFAVTRLMSALLFDVAPTDVVTFAAMASLMGLVALLASYVPARRSARVDPLIALRHE